MNKFLKNLGYALLFCLIGHILVAVPVSATFLISIPGGDEPSSTNCFDGPPPFPLFGGDEHSGTITPKGEDGEPGDPQPFTMQAGRGPNTSEYQSGTLQVGDGFFAPTGTYEAWIDDEGVFHLEAEITVPGVFSDDTYNISMTMNQDGDGSVATSDEDGNPVSENYFYDGEISDTSISFDTYGYSVELETQSDDDPASAGSNRCD